MCLARSTTMIYPSFDDDDDDEFDDYHDDNDDNNADDDHDDNDDYILAEIAQPYIIHEVWIPRTLHNSV